MSNTTTAFRNELLDGLLGVAPLTLPDTVYLALFTADPTDTGDVSNELSGNGYNRVSLDGLFSNAVSGTSSNTSEVLFDTATADWPTVTHIGYMKSNVQGTADMMNYDDLDEAVDIASGEAFIFKIGNLSLTVV